MTNVSRRIFLKRLGFGTAAVAAVAVGAVLLAIWGTQALRHIPDSPIDQAATPLKWADHIDLSDYTVTYGRDYRSFTFEPPFEHWRDFEICRGDTGQCVTLTQIFEGREP